ncbi:hypothetical protein YA0002_04565 [Pseudomonas cichorii]|uniref:hypothetical protein n=1 Tax=Pseudomonas cichorii TaxID=36746 RepID=UPI0018E62835|nr:hypothetical protein [Pseudomonas cichorii]MBI6852029.1 hypothetical protein [Pseudomonas cichorii]
MCKYGLALAVLSPLVISPGLAVAAQPDWWLIFGSGDQPKRQVMYADAISVADSRSKTTEEAARSVDVVNVFEEEDKPSYVIYRVSFQCKAGQYRVEAAKAQMRSGETTAEPTNRHWEPVAQSLMERPYDFVCQASSRRSNSMIKVGSMSVTILSDFTKKALWGPAINTPPK